ncbi:MAG: SDR family NAD(P)-dependent oxidoreductase [Planctomycetota bacterium]
MSTSTTSQEDVLILGATSGIGRAVAQAYAKRGVGKLILAGRDEKALDQDAADLRTRYETHTEVRLFDAVRPETFTGVLDGLPSLHIAVLCHGMMLSNDTARSDPEAHRRMIEVNYTSYTLLLERLADHLHDPEGYQGGVIAVVSSVAGDRGRGSNYCYGATKAALTAYADGLRGRLHGSGVHVVTVKPGPVQTAMTYGLDGYDKMADPERVAGQIVEAIDKRRDTVYTPRKWRFIMAVIRAIPERLFKRLSI